MEIYRDIILYDSDVPKAGEATTPNPEKQMCQIIQKERRNDLGMNWKTYLPELRKRGIHNAAQAAAALAAIKSAPGASAFETCPYQSRETLVSTWNWYSVLLVLLLMFASLAIGFLCGWKCRGVSNNPPLPREMETNEEPDPQPAPDAEEEIAYNGLEVVVRENNDNINGDENVRPRNVMINLGREGIIHLPPHQGRDIRGDIPRFQSVDQAPVGTIFILEPEEETNPQVGDNLRIVQRYFPTLRNDVVTRRSAGDFWISIDSYTMDRLNRMIRDQFSIIVLNHLVSPQRKMHLRRNCSGLTSAASDPITREFCEICFNDTMDRFSRAMFSTLYSIRQETVVMTQRDVVYIPSADGV